MESAALRKMIDQLRQEWREINYAIHALEALAAGKPRRGRPPKLTLEPAEKGPRPVRKPRLRAEKPQ